MVADTLVETHSCYAAICDEASPANRLGFMTSELEAGKKAARQAGQDESFGLFAFNDRLMASAARGELLAWTLLLDGVFRAVADLEQSVPQPQMLKNLSASMLAGTLICQTGRLVVTCLGRLGVKQQPLLVVEPGVYRVQLKRDETQEFDHGALERASSYPPGHGPDWHFRLQRVGPLPAGA